MSLANQASWSRVPAWLGPVALLLTSLFFIGVVLWGTFNPVPIQVQLFDAGPVTQFAIHKVVAYPERNLYIVGMEDGRLRAIDGRINGTTCRVEWRPDDPRGAVRNPQGLPGVFHDPCSGALWSFEGNAISGTMEPLRTPRVAPKAVAAGEPEHVTVEMVNPQK